MVLYIVVQFSNGNDKAILLGWSMDKGNNDDMGGLSTQVAAKI